MAIYSRESPVVVLFDLGVARLYTDHEGNVILSLLCKFVYHHQFRFVLQERAFPSKERGSGLPGAL